MYGGSNGDGLQIEVYVRSLQPRGDTAQQRAFDKLDELVDEGVVEEYEVVVWGDRVPPTPDALRTRAGRFVLDRVVVFQRWAEENDCSIEHAFEVRTVDSTITGQQYSELLLPHLVIAAVEGDRLVDLAPVSVNGTHVSALDLLDRLARREPLPEPTAVELRPLQRSESTEPERITEQPVTTVETLDDAVEALTSESGLGATGGGPESRSTSPPKTDEPEREEGEFERSETDPAAGDPSSATYPPY